MIKANPVHNVVMIVTVTVTVTAPEIHEPNGHMEENSRDAKCNAPDPNDKGDIIAL
jgi:hypothetical protein